MQQQQNANHIRITEVSHENNVSSDDFM